MQNECGTDEQGGSSRAAHGSASVSKAIAAYHLIEQAKALLHGADEQNSNGCKLAAKCDDWTKCGNARCVRSTWDAERYECAVCGEKWTIYEDELK